MLLFWFWPPSWLLLLLLLRELQQQQLELCSQITWPPRPAAMQRPISANQTHNSMASPFHLLL